MPTATPSSSTALAGAAASPSAGGAVHRPALLGYARQLLESDAGRAEEIVDTVLAETPPSAEDTTGERTAERLFAACRRRVFAGRRESGWQGSAAEGETKGTTIADQILGLTAKQKEAVWLRFKYGFNYDAIARITRFSQPQVAFVLHSALSHLRKERATNADTLATSDDPRVTTYALDEMSGDERAAFERDLKTDKTARLVAREVGSLASELTSELGGSGPRRPVARRMNALRRAAGRWSLIAGGIALVAGGAWWWWDRREPEAAAEAAPERATLEMKPDSWRLNSAKDGRERTESAAPAGVGTRAVAQRRPANASADTATHDPIRARRNDDDTPVIVRSSGASGVGAATETRATNGAAPDTPTRLSNENAATIAAQPNPLRTAARANAAVANNPSAPPATASAATTAPSGDHAAPGQEPRGAGRGAAAATPAAGAPTNQAAEPRTSSSRDNAPSTATVPAAGSTDAASATPLLREWRAALAAGRLPTPGEVHTAELIDEFPADAPASPTSDEIAVAVEVARAPWAPEHRLARVVVTAPETTRAASAVANVVLLVDVSGSMAAPNRLPLVQTAARRWLETLRPDDRVALVTYAGAAQVTLAPTSAAKRADILTALGELHAEGPTNASAGLRVAFAQARAGFVAGGVNRVVLCSDGEFNAGITDAGELAALVRQQALEGITLSVFGFGRGRNIDARMEALAVQGQGMSGYLDTRLAAESALAAQVSSGTAVSANELRLEIVTDPARVAGWRLIGRDDQMLPPEAAHQRPALLLKNLAPGRSRTALYEFEVPAVSAKNVPAAGQLLFTVLLGAGPKSPAVAGRRTQTVNAFDRDKRWEAASASFRFASAVAGLGLALNEIPPQMARLTDVVRWATDAAAHLDEKDPGGYRDEFIALARETETLARTEP